NVLTPTVNMNGYSRKSPSKRRYEGSKYSVRHSSESEDKSPQNMKISSIGRYEWLQS
ncbi:hypothetical protein DOY81_013113, partial [Sarcophaga bullata]